MPEIKLGAYPQLLSGGDLALIKEKLNAWRIFPNNEAGYFTANGDFNLVSPVGAKNVWGEINFEVEEFWSYDLLGLNSQKMRLCKTALGLVASVKGGHHSTSVKIQPESIRYYSKNTSGLAHVTPDGYVLPPRDMVGCYIGEHWQGYHKLLEEIRKGRESEECRGFGISFYRLADLSLADNEIDYLALSTPTGKKDAVLVCRGRLLDRVRVFPWISQGDFERFYS